MIALNTCILIKTRPTLTDEVLEKTRKLSGIRKAFVAYGRYDLLAFAFAPDYSGIRELSSAIDAIDGVRSTESLVEA